MGELASGGFTTCTPLAIRTAMPTIEHPTPHAGSPDAGSPDAGSTRLPHVAGLDGLRAVAVVLVLLFHNGFTWMRGGFLGVSVFFTLSGYLITTLLVGEHRATGGVSLRGFWSRRFRRLLPASLLAIALALLFGLVAADPAQRAELGGDTVASLAYVANWWFLASEQTYAALFSAPSPLLHFWSLAIEEQFYLLLPLAAVATLGRRRLFAVVIVVALAITVAIPFVTSASDDWLYYATPARLPELLTGVLAALVLSQRNLRQRIMGSSAVVLPTIVGLGALAATVWLAATSSISSSWLYRGGFAAFSLVSVALVVSAHSPRALGTRLLALPPVVHLGHISYGVYLYHWPIFLWVDPARTGLDGWPLFAVRLAITLVLAELSYRFVEMPIRRTGRLPLAGLLPSLGRLAPVSVAVLAAGAVLASATAPPKAIDFDRATDELASLATLDQSPELPASDQALDQPPELPALDPAAAAPTPEEFLALLPVDPPAPRVAMFGDSTALMTALGLGRVMGERPDEMTFARGVTLLGCSVALGGKRLLAADQVDTIPERCRQWPESWPQQARTSAPNVALIQIGPWDVMTRKVTPGGDFVQPGDPEWDAAVTDELLVAVDRLAATGAWPLVATAPLPNRNLDPTTHFAGPENVDPARFAHLNTLIARLPELRPGRVGVVDLAGWHAGRDDDLQLRPDGVHLGDGAGALMSRGFLFDEILRQYDAAWRSGDAPRLVAEAAAARARHPAPPALAPGEALRVAVWSDERTSAIIEQVSVGAAEAGIPIELRVVGVPGCGIARSVERRVADVTTTPEPVCADRFLIADDLADFNPHVVVVAPGIHEAAEHRPWNDWDQWKVPEDPMLQMWLLTEFGTAVDLAGRTGALVGVVGLAPGEGDPHNGAVNLAIAGAATAPDRAAWATRLDAAANTSTWAAGVLTRVP